MSDVPFSTTIVVALRSSRTPAIAWGRVSLSPRVSSGRSIPVDPSRTPRLIRPLPHVLLPVPQMSVLGLRGASLCVAASPGIGDINIEATSTARIAAIQLGWTLTSQTGPVREQ
jgi:hypothetical protein